MVRDSLRWEGQHNRGHLPTGARLGLGLGLGLGFRVRVSGFTICILFTMRSSHVLLGYQLPRVVPLLCFLLGQLRLSFVPSKLLFY